MCLEKNWPRGGEDWAAVGVLLNSGRVLLIKRVAREGDPWSGHVAFPGGRWKPGEDLLLTAVREVMEEVGVEPARLVGVLPPHSPRNAPWLKVVPFVFDQWRGEVAPNPAEVEEARWAARVDLKEGEWLGRPAFFFGGWVVWGLTYRVLKMLIDCGLL
ncbi:MAG: CoA pyrophosphatase [Pyrobaculum sp.]